MILSSIHRLLRTEDWNFHPIWKHGMKLREKMVEIAFRNYNSYVYNDASLQQLLAEEMAEV